MFGQQTWFPCSDRAAIRQLRSSCCCVVLPLTPSASEIETFVTDLVNRYSDRIKTTWSDLFTKTTLCVSKSHSRTFFGRSAKCAWIESMRKQINETVSKNSMHVFHYQCNVVQTQTLNFAKIENIHFWSSETLLYIGYTALC